MNSPDDERDRAIGTAWRSASDEQPPAALDAMLRAAARREVAAGPRAADSDPTARDSARRRTVRPWLPLAAAAAIAFVAVGIVQLTPPEQVIPSVSPTASPMSSAPSLAANSPAKESGLRDAADAPPRTQLPAPAQPAPQPQLQPRSPSTAAADARRNESRNAPRGEPFPAAPDSVAQSTPRTQPASEVDRVAVAGGGAVSASGVATGPDAVDRASNDSIAAAPSANAAKTEARVDAPAQPARAKIAAAGQPNEQQFGQLLAKDAAPRSVDEWLRLLRRLKSENNDIELARQLAAFRTTYGDRADALLPSELRALKP